MDGSDLPSEFRAGESNGRRAVHDEVGRTTNFIMRMSAKEKKQRNLLK